MPGPRLRAGLTEVPVKRDADEMNDGEREADRGPGGTGRGDPTGCTQHDEDEQKGQDDLGCERAAGVESDHGVLAHPSVPSPTDLV